MGPVSRSLRRRKSPRDSGSQRSNSQGSPRASSKSGRKGIATGIGAVSIGLSIAWLTPTGPWVWAKIFPSPTISASVTFPDASCGSFLVPMASKASRSDADFGTPTWALRNGASQAAPYWPGRGTSRVLFTITGYQPRPVTITGLTFKVSKRGPAPVAGRVESGQCGDATVARYAIVNLDIKPPRITESSAVKITWGNQVTTPLTFPYTVTSTNTESLLLMASTSESVEWTAQLAWSDGTTSGSLPIDNEGHAFRTAVSP